MKNKNYENVKRWRKNNPQKVKEQWQRYYKKHAEEIKAKKRKHYRSIKENENIQDKK